MTNPIPPAEGAALILDAAAIERALKRIAHEIIGPHHSDSVVRYLLARG